MQWLRDNLKLIGSSGEVEALAASVPDTGGVVFVPAFVGLGAPHWDAHAAGMLIGLRRDTTPGHIARAALESIAFQVADVLEAVQSETGTPLDGAARGWRRGGERSADAVPGRCAGRSGGASAGDGDDGAGRGVPGGAGDGILGRVRRRCAAERQGDVRFEPKMDASRAGRAARRGGRGPWSGRRNGREDRGQVLRFGYAGPGW